MSNESWESIFEKFIKDIEEIELEDEGFLSSLYISFIIWYYWWLKVFDDKGGFGRFFIYLKIIMQMNKYNIMYGFKLLHWLVFINQKRKGKKKEMQLK